MKKIAMLMLAMSVLLSGCIVYDRPHHRDGGMHRGDHDRDHDRGHERRRDSDRDGIPDRRDHRPYDRDRY